MSNEERQRIFKEYLLANVGPILVDFLKDEELKNGVIVDANCDMSLLNGHYQEGEFLPPEWYQTLVSKKKKLLIIKDIDSISKEEQLKFVPILQYRQVTPTYKLPKDTVVVVTAKKINKDTISQRIYSSVVHVGD